MLLIPGTAHKEWLLYSVTKHFTYISKSIQLKPLNLQGMPLSDSDNPTCLALIICLAQCEATQQHNETHSPALALVLSLALGFLLCIDGIQRALHFWKSPKRSFLTFCLGPPNVYPVVRVASCWVSPWQRLMGSGFSTLESSLCAIYIVIEQGQCNRSNHSQ